MDVGRESGSDARTEHTLGHTREHGREGPRCMRVREQRPRGSWTRTDPGGSPSQPRRSALQACYRLGPVPEEPRRHTGPEQRRRANERGVQRALSAKLGWLSGSVLASWRGNRRCVARCSFQRPLPAFSQTLSAYEPGRSPAAVRASIRSVYNRVYASTASGTTSR